MSNAVYGPEADEEQGYRNPDLGPGHDSAAGRSSDPRSGASATGDASDPRGEGSDSLNNIRSSESSGGGLYNAKGDSSAESGKSLSDQEASGSDGGLYNPGKKRGNGRAATFLKKNRGKVTLALAGITGGFTILGITFMGLSSFGLPNLMANIEQKAFGRYQVDMNGRSSEWLKSYMMLRMAEVDDSHLTPADRDNLLFRSNKVDNNNPLKDWYRTLRASQFEQDVFESRGIKFTSVAYRDGNVIKTRPGLVTFKTGEKVKFDFSYGEMQAIQSGNVNGFNNRLRQFVDVKVYDNDKEARGAIKALVREQYPQWWKAVKRWHLRQDIQNMIGVRKWSFFEKQRQAVTEKKISVRNKIITQALPEDSKSGKIIKCLFGIDSCTASSDPANPKARAYTPDPSNPRPGDASTNTSGSPSTAVGDGSGNATLQSGADAAGQEVIRKTIISKLFGAAGIVSMLDSLARFNESIHNHTFSKLVVQNKGQMAVGAAAVYAIAADQLKTGEVNGDEVGQFMDQMGDPTKSEAWSSVIDPAQQSSELTNYEAQNKKAFCSEAHQENMAKPENQQKAMQEFQYLCPADRVGGANKAQEMEDTWNSGPGAILGTILAPFHGVFGGLVDLFNQITGAITGPIVSGAISALGLQGTIKDIGGYIAEKAMQFGGGTLNINDSSPPGKLTNTVMQGDTVLAEASMRDQGGALTTVQSAALATKNYVAYQQDQKQGSAYDRYVALSSPTSFLSKQLFAISTWRFGSLPEHLISGLGSLLTSPLRLLSMPTHAATHAIVDDGYNAVRFTGVTNNTYDMPIECMSAKALDATPQNSTNADDLGMFTSDELTWDMMTNKKTWYDALYAKVGDNEALAQKVYNCALFDNTVRGGIGSIYGYKGDSAYGSN